MLRAAAADDDGRPLQTTQAAGLANRARVPETDGMPI